MVLAASRAIDVCLPIYFLIIEFQDNNLSLSAVTALDNMPIITIATYSGRDQTEKDRFAEAITEDVVEILEVPKKDVIVVFQEVPYCNWDESGVRL